MSREKNRFFLFLPHFHVTHAKIVLDKPVSRGNARSGACFLWHVVDFDQTQLEKRAGRYAYWTGGVPRETYPVSSTSFCPSGESMKSTIFRVFAERGRTETMYAVATSG